MEISPYIKIAAILKGVAAILINQDYSLSGGINNEKIYYCNTWSHGIWNRNNIINDSS